VSSSLLSHSPADGSKSGSPAPLSSSEQGDGGGGGGSAAGTPQGGAAVASNPMANMTQEESARFKREYVLKELVETEQQYVQDLASVVEGYIANLSSMELPEDLQGKDKIIFANIAQIHDFHRT
jgi:RhoGEF domain